MRVRETIAGRLDAAPVVPLDPLAIMARGTVTIAGAVTEFGYSRATLERLIAAGKLPVVDNPDVKRLLIPRAALELYLAQRLAFRSELVVLPAARRRRRSAA